MKASELIKELQELIELHGDLEVEQYSDDYEVASVQFIPEEAVFNATFRLYGPCK